jgi:hypothetical protein
MVVSANTETLLSHMTELSSCAIASAAQLRVVEGIATDVALSFRRPLDAAASN